MHFFRVFLCLSLLFPMAAKAGDHQKTKTKRPTAPTVEKLDYQPLLKWEDDPIKFELIRSKLKSIKGIQDLLKRRENWVCSYGKMINISEIALNSLKTKLTSRTALRSYKTTADPAADALLKMVPQDDLDGYRKVARIYRYTPAGQTALKKLMEIYVDKGDYELADLYAMAWESSLKVRPPENKTSPEVSGGYVITAIIRAKLWKKKQLPALVSAAYTAGGNSLKAGNQVVAPKEFLKWLNTLSKEPKLFPSLDFYSSDRNRRIEIQKALSYLSESQLRKVLELSLRIASIQDKELKKVDLCAVIDPNVLIGLGATDPKYFSLGKRIANLLDDSKAEKRAQDLIRKFILNKSLDYITEDNKLLALGVTESELAGMAIQGKPLEFRRKMMRLFRWLNPKSKYFISALVKSLEDPNTSSVASKMLPYMSNDAVVSILKNRLSHKKPYVRKHTVWLLLDSFVTHLEPATPQLLKLLNDKNQRIRAYAAKAIIRSFVYGQMFQRMTQRLKTAFKKVLLRGSTNPELNKAISWEISRSSAFWDNELVRRFWLRPETIKKYDYGIIPPRFK